MVKAGVFFKKFGLFFFTHRFKTIFFFMILTILALISFKNLKIDVRIESFLKTDDPVLVEYYKFREEFDNDELIIIGVRGDEIFNMNFLSELNRLHNEIEEKVPYIDEVTSLINVRNTRGDEDQLIVEDLFEKFPENQKEIEEIKERVRINPLYKNLVVSEDLMTTALVIRLLSFSPEKENDFNYIEDFDKENTGLKKLSVEEYGKAVEAADKIVKKYDRDGFKTYLSGTACVDHFLKNILPVDAVKFLLLAYAAVILLLGIIFKRISGVLMPLLIVSLTLIFTISLFSVFGVAIKLPTQTLPSFLLAVSVCYSVHILALFYYYLDSGATKKEAIGSTLAHSGKAILLTGITTAAGLFSISGSKVAPIGELGLFAGGGVFVAVFLTFILLPPLISFLPEKGNKKISEKKHPLMDRFLIMIASFATRRPWAILVTALIIALVCFTSFKNIRFIDDTLRWLPATESIRTDTEYLDDAMKGTVSMEIILDTKKENGLYDPKILKAIDSVSKEIESLKTDEVATGKAWSIAEIVKETNKALHSNNENFYSIPDSRDLCAQELFLFSNSGSDDLEDFTDSGFTKARISVKVPFVHAIAFTNYIEKVESLLKKRFHDLSFTITGVITIYSSVTAKAIESMGISYLIAIAVVTILMIILLGDLKLGLLSMIPNLFPIIVIVGLTGLLDIPFSLYIMLIGNIVVGLAVDDTIHFMHNYKNSINQGFSCEEAVERTLLTSGRAMLVTSIILATAFFIYIFSILNHLIHFGILTGSSIIIALLADFLIAPALLKIFISHGENTVEVSEIKEAA